MKNEQFAEIVDQMYVQCTELLDVKEKQYSDGVDRLIQFKTAANLAGHSPVNALAGMMIKHTTKLYTMLGDGFGKHNVEQWEETLNDHVNYLFLLKAVLIEEGEI